MTRPEKKAKRMARQKHKGVYPGTFDPVTTGHLDIIRRACLVLDHLVIGVALSAGKNPLFDVDERVALIEASVAEIDTSGCNIEVKSFDSLLVDFVADQDASSVIRGIRAVSDFEYEFQLATMNHRLDSQIETIFLTASENQQFIASSLIKEIGRLGGDVTSFVSQPVLRAMTKKFQS